MEVYLCKKYSSFYDDKLIEEEDIFYSEELAEAWKKKIEMEVMENINLPLPILDGTDKIADEYNRIEKANKFISCEIKPKPVLREL